MKRGVPCLFAVGCLAVMVTTADAAIMDDDSSALFIEGTTNEATVSLPAINATNAYGNLLSGAAAEKELAERIESARIAVAKNPSVSKNYRVLGELLTQAGRLDEAAEAYWRSSRMEPLNVAPLHFLGFTLLALGDHENGLKIYKQIESKYPDARKVLFNLGSAYYGLKDYDQAASYYRNFIDTAKREDPRSFYNLGVTLLAMNRADEAAPWLDKAAAKMPANPFVVAALIRAQHELGDEEKIKQLDTIAGQKFGPDGLKPILDAQILPAFLDR